MVGGVGENKRKKKKKTNGGGGLLSLTGTNVTALGAGEYGKWARGKEAGKENIDGDAGGGRWWNNM